jgi:hypothetical protein
LLNAFAKAYPLASGSEICKSTRRVNAETQSQVCRSEQSSPAILLKSARENCEASNTNIATLLDNSQRAKFAAWQQRRQKAEAPAGLFI